MKLCSPSALLLSAIVPLALTARADAQPAERAAEVAQLEEALRRVEAALAALEPVVSPEVTLAQYDVRHLFLRAPDRAAPSLTIPADAAGYRTGAGAPAGGMFSFDDTEEHEGALVAPDQLEAIVMTSVGHSEWDAPRSIEVAGGFLIVRQTPANHARIRALLGRLEDQVRAVQLEVGFYALPADVQRELETAAAGADGVLSPDVLARLDARVGQGSVALTSAAMLSGMSGQRVFLHQGDERAFVVAYERSSGGTGNVVEVVSDPVVEVLRSGISLDLRPLVADGDRPSVQMDVRFARSVPLALETRPTPWGPIDTPHLSQDAVKTSARVPQGAGMLVFTLSGEGERNVAIIVRPRVVSGR